MTISATERNDQPRFVLTPRVVDVTCDDEALGIRLADGRELSTSLAWFPRLLAATPAAHGHWELIGGGEGIHWPELDEDISVASLLGLPTD